jgi:hypothetical protein
MACELAEVTAYEAHVDTREIAAVGFRPGYLLPAGDTR